jgi:hypothetical protein
LSLLFVLPCRLFDKCPAFSYLSLNFHFIIISPLKRSDAEVFLNSIQFMIQCRRLRKWFCDRSQRCCLFLRYQFEFLGK